MKSMQLLAMFSITSGVCFGHVLDICAAQGNGAWLAVQSFTELEEVSLVCLYLIEDGETFPVDTMGTVRSDAAHCRLIPRAEGGCFSATSTGTGYTAISLRAHNPDGSVDWELVEDGDCYDAPCGLLETVDGGVLMLWDSWSTGRGLWVMRVSPDGEQIWKTFVLPTLHPFYTAFCAHGDDGCLVAAAVVAVGGDFAMTALDSVGDETEAWSVGVLENLGASTPMSIRSSDEGAISVWADTPVPENLDDLIVIRDRSGSLDSWSFSLRSLSGAVLLEAVGGGFIAAGGVESTWVCTTDLTGAVTWSYGFGSAFVPVAMDSGNGFILVAGDCEEGFLVACVEPGGGEVWSLRQNQ